jgi:exodeoxyribonuclease V beta subunit
MRSETDAQCVQIVTFHKSKGLEYPLVFVPFSGSFSAKEKGTGKTSDDSEEASDITETSVDEDTRLLYVALTRAKRGLWLGLAPTRDAFIDVKSKGKGKEPEQAPTECSCTLVETPIQRRLG